MRAILLLHPVRPDRHDLATREPDLPVVEIACQLGRYIIHGQQPTRETESEEIAHGA